MSTQLASTRGVTPTVLWYRNSENDDITDVSSTGFGTGTSLSSTATLPPLPVSTTAPTATPTATAGGRRLDWSTVDWVMRHWGRRSTNRTPDAVTHTYLWLALVTSTTTVPGFLGLVGAVAVGYSLHRWAHRYTTLSDHDTRHFYPATLLAHWNIINTQLDWMHEQQHEASRDVVYPLSPEALATTRRFFTAMDSQHVGSLSKADVHRAVSYLDARVTLPMLAVSLDVSHEFDTRATPTVESQEPRLLFPAFVDILHLIQRQQT